MVSVSEIAQVGPGGAPYRFGGSPRGEGPPRLRTRGGPHTRPTPCGVGQPRLRLGIVAQNARTKAESIHDRGKGGSGEWRNITPLRRGLTHPRGQKSCEVV